MSFANQVHSTAVTLKQALREAEALAVEVRAETITNEVARRWEADVVLLLLEALVQLGVNVSDVPGPERFAEVLGYWPPNVRVVVSLLPNEGTGGRMVKPWKVDGEER
ncbi:MAG TPA: hypothetical protein VN908_06510 [Gemmatimonadales bacterium]|nr:hypothetical protein [Gemmatimonadales bacterium]